MAMDQPDHHLFVLVEVGSGRSTLMRELAHGVASTRPVSPTGC
jgi:tRNA A37 threonylcarbamoyladenosine biosynthesis protein TsaE